MSQLTQPQLDLLRAERHSQELWISALPKVILWTAQINDSEIVKGEVLINWDNGASGPTSPSSPKSNLGFSDVEPLQTVWVGSIAGEYDVGKLRIRDITSGDGGVTGILKVGGHSLDLTDDLHLTFIHHYEVNPKWPFIDPDTEVFFRDDDLDYAAAGNPNSPPGPVMLAGPNRAKFIDETTLSAEFTINLSNSYVMAPGATITNYGATVTPSNGVIVSIDSGTGMGTITFDDPGAYWVKFSITDSNGRTQTGYRCFIVHGLNPTAETYPLTNFRVNSLSGEWSTGGWSMSVEFYSEATFDRVPDGTVIILWGDAFYGDQQVNINFAPVEYNNILFSGYVHNQQIRHDNVGGVHTAAIECVTAQEILRSIYTYSVPLEATASPSDWNEYPLYLTPGRAARYVIEWHSTAFQLCDFLSLVQSPEYFRKYFEYTEGDLYSILDTLTYQNASREKLLCDEMGRFHLVRDLQLDNDTNRANATVTAEFSDRDLGEGPLEVVHNEATNAMTWSSGFSYDGAGGEPEPHYSLAPGLKPHRRGASPGNYDRQTFLNEEDALVTVGRYWSRDNNPFPEVRLNLHGNYRGVFKPHLREWWEINLASTDTVRELIWTDKKLLCRSTNISFVYEEEKFTGIVQVSVTMEPEAPPARGVPWEYTDLPPIDIWDEPDWPTTNGGLMTAGSVWFLPPLVSTWVERSTEATEDMYEDPFWASKQGTDDSNQAIVWRVKSGAVERTTDAGQTWTGVTPTTDPVNFYNDSPAPTAGDVTFVNIEPNYSFSSEFVVGARWFNGSEWRSWVVTTPNDGASWTWIPVI